MVQLGFRLGSDAASTHGVATCGMRMPRSEASFMCQAPSAKGARLKAGQAAGRQEVKRVQKWLDRHELLTCSCAAGTGAE